MRRSAGVLTYEMHAAPGVDLADLVEEHLGAVNGCACRGHTRHENLRKLSGP